MFDLSLLKHAAEFRRYLRNRQFEVTPQGVVFTRAAAVANGMYFYDTNGEDPGESPNLLPDEGLIYLLSVGLNNGTKLATWYLSLYAANYTPCPASRLPATQPRRARSRPTPRGTPGALARCGRRPRPPLRCWTTSPTRLPSRSPRLRA